jgi:hypothetical protein
MASHTHTQTHTHTHTHSLTLALSLSLLHTQTYTHYTRYFSHTHTCMQTNYPITWTKVVFFAEFYRKYVHFNSSFSFQTNGFERTHDTFFKVGQCLFCPCFIQMNSMKINPNFLCGKILSRQVYMTNKIKGKIEA